MNAVRWSTLVIGALAVAAFISSAVLVATGHASALAILALTGAVEVAIYFSRRAHEPPRRGKGSGVLYPEPTTRTGC